MIQRYLLKEMENIFSDESRFNAYLQVEIAVLEAWSKIGVIPNQDVHLPLQRHKNHPLAVYTEKPYLLHPHHDHCFQAQ